MILAVTLDIPCSWVKYSTHKKCTLPREKNFPQILYQSISFSMKEIQESIRKEKKEKKKYDQKSLVGIKK